MSVRYNKDFKMEVVKAYMAGDKSTAQLAAEYNVAKFGNAVPKPLQASQLLNFLFFNF